MWYWGFMICPAVGLRRLSLIHRIKVLYRAYQASHCRHSRGLGICPPGAKTLVCHSEYEAQSALFSNLDLGRWMLVFISCMINSSSGGVHFSLYEVINVVPSSERLSADKLCPAFWVERSACLIDKAPPHQPSCRIWTLICVTTRG